jgi:1-phosphofructokinase family hexose kinase
MIIALALSASLDVTYEVDAFHFGDITRPRTVTRVAGGKALNVARAAKTLGADVLAVAALGGATGDWIERMLADEEIPVCTVALRAATRTCIAVVEDAESATSTDLYEPATTLTADEWEAYAAAVRSAIRSADRGAWLALSGSIPPGVPLDGLAALLAEARDRGVRVVVDGSGPGLRATVSAADLVKVNRREASELLGVDVPTAAEACALLRERYGVDAVVTDGIHGSAARVGGITATTPAVVLRGRFPAGSGDAFLGGLLAAFVRGVALDEALRAAASAGVRNALVPGQGRLAPTQAESDSTNGTP